ncbi:alpha-2-macroglobulin family protein [Chitinophaga alhagiae]|nr:alpha-2-macroglobulin family protein [Chitinophaga alhagiae]
MKHWILFLILICACAGKAAAQAPDYASNKEKIYMQTSHAFFKPGDEMFFKLYLVHAQNNTPSNVSHIVYVDVLGPSGNLAAKLTYPVKHGYTEGSYAFPPSAAGGVYKLRAYTAWMKNEKDSTFFTKEVTVQHVISPRILMKLDFPQKGYGPGSTVTAHFSARSLADRPLAHQTFRYTVSLAGQSGQPVTLQTDGAGKAAVQFQLPASLSTTDGLLNITVEHDAYVEAISRSIPITLNKVYLQLMPEGGALVEGLPANVAFRAVNEFGKPVDVTGQLRDGSGQVITGLQSFHHGMGQFAFTPQPGRTYEVQVTSPANVVQPLPAAAAKGVAMQLTAAKGRLLMHLHATQSADVKITGYTKEQLYFSQNTRLKKGAQSVSIDPALFPAGIARFTVSQANGLPLAERIMFLHPEKMLQVEITPDKARYMPREKVTLRLKTLNYQGQPVPSNFSLSVLDDKLWTFADDRQDHLISWLMISSELKGKIEEPQFYFKKDEEKAAPALDLLMLTHGYRYFDYLPSVEQENRLKFLPDMQHIISGKVVNGRNEPVRAKVWLVLTSSVVMQLLTGDDGEFYFPGLQHNGYYMVVAQSMQKKEPIRLVMTADIKNGPLLRANAAAAAPLPLPAQAPPAAQGDKNLEEVVVVGFNGRQKQLVTGAVTVITGRDINEVSVNNALAGRVAGVNVTERANPAQAPGVQIRGSTSIAGDNTPLMIVDGIPMEWTGQLNPAEIAAIYVVKDPAASAIYGSAGARGVIIVETKKNSGSRLRWTHAPRAFYASQQVQLNGPGFTPVRRFNAPLYPTTETAERTDFRETIYWNPVVQTDKNGEASVSFYNSDATTTFRAIAEGIGYNGLAGRAETTYAVQPLLSVDAKIPPYLTVGDNALIPLHIKNNDTHPLDADIQVAFTESVKAGIFNKTIHLAPGAAQVVYVPVTATSPVEGSLRFTVSSPRHTETVSLPVTVVHKGFPVVETFAGNRSAQHRFTVNKMVPGSLRYELKLFNNPEGQLLDGVAAMLREPYGCFEQTSSATYPNIFILKYLRESGRANPAIERQAMDYIEKGYKRLIGFETTEGGFEWFGKTPPHEALTAYGLMEFTDMSEFIAVDRQMLKRTKKFLLGRRDGKGGFLLSTSGYDRFATVPNKIANIYIVYAFSHAGYGSEVTREYEHALANVLKGNDAYELSMMALTASNMHRQADFERLMKILRGHYRQKTFKAATSVVNSRATSLKVETGALYLLALAREKKPELPLMAELMTDIMRCKSYFGYSSTQATVLALNAVIAYARVFGKAAAETDIRFLLNNRAITPGIIPAPETPAARNSFEVAYGGAENNVPYNMEVSYYTFTPPSSPLAELRLHTSLAKRQVKMGGTVRMEVSVTNEKAMLQGMSIAKIGIPAGLSAQPWQLKELMEKNEVAYYEIFDNYLVFYWMGFAPEETKTLRLDLKADIPGTYTAKAGNAGLYYMPEHKHWNEGLEAEVLP